MSPAHERTLAALAECEPVTAADLAARLGLARVTVSSRLVQLKRLGLALDRRDGNPGLPRWRAVTS